MTDLWWEADTGCAPPVVLFHEGAGSSRVWEPVRRELPVGDRQIVTYDRRGYGRSPHDDVWTAEHFDQAARDAAQLLEAVGGGPAHLLGHSDGGSVALLVAARRPDLVASAIVVATHVHADVGTVRAVRGLGPPTDWDERTRQRYEEQHGADWQHIVSGWLSMWSDGTLSGWDIRPELAQITCPVLVVHDRRDPLSPAEHADAITEAVETNTVRWYDDGSHRPHLANAQRFRADVAAFWQSASVPE